jgi:hypothetical protein
MNEDKMYMTSGMYEREEKGCRNFIKKKLKVKMSFERLQVRRRTK